MIVSNSRILFLIDSVQAFFFYRSMIEYKGCIRQPVIEAPVYFPYLSMFFCV